MRASFICLVLYSIGIIGPAYVGGIEVYPRQDVNAVLPTKSTPTTTLSPDASSKPSKAVASVNAVSGTPTSKIDTNATTSIGNDTSSTESPRPSDLSFLNGTELDPNALPLRPKITPGLSIAGVVLIISGGVHALIGTRNKWIQIFFSVAFSTALAVTALIIYLMQPPVRDAVQGAFVVAATVTGIVFGGTSLLFQEATEGFGCLLGGFSLSMWILPMKPGGLLIEVGHKAAFIISLTIGLYSLSFIHRTRPYALIFSTSFSGSTAAILGIDCFSRAGLKEFWVYLWELNEKVFPSNTKTYPITRGIRAELAGIVAIFLMGLLSQAKLWKVIKDRRRKEAALLEEEQKKRDQIEEEIARNLEEGTSRDRAQWESIYGGQERPPNDSGIDIEQAADHERHLATPENRTPAGQTQIYEMDALHRPAGDTRSRKPIQSLISATQSDTPLSNGSSSEDAQDTNPNIAPGHQPGLHELPADHEKLVPSNTVTNSVRANPFEVRADDECSSAAASLAESDYMECVHTEMASGDLLRHSEPEQTMEGNLKGDDGDGFTFVNDTRSISSSVKVEANEELDYNVGPRQVDSGTLCSPSSVYSNFQGTAEPTFITEPDSSVLDSTNDNEGAVINNAPAPVLKIRWADYNTPKKTPRLANRNQEFDENAGVYSSESDQTPATDIPSPESDESSTGTVDQKSTSTRASVAVEPVTESISADQRTSDKHDKPSDASGSLMSSIPVPKRLSKMQSALPSRAKLTSESVDSIANHMSRAVLSHRTNEWAKHISDAEPPEIRETDEVEQDAEIDEPAAPVLVSELKQTATGALPFQGFDTDNSASSRSHHEEDLGLVPSSPRKSYTGFQTTNSIPAPSPVKSSNSTNRSKTPPIHPLHRSGSSSTLNVAGQSDRNGTRPASSIPSIYIPANSIPEMNKAHDRSPPTRKLRMPSSLLLAQRETAVRNRSLLLPSNYSSPNLDRLSRSQSQLSLKIPPQTACRSFSPHPSHQHHSNVESADDLPLSVRRQLIHRDMHTQNQAQTPPGRHRRTSLCSYLSLDNMSLVTPRRQYQDHAQEQDLLQVREAKLARWRESFREENLVKHLPDAALETRRADLLKKLQRSQLRRQKEAIKDSHRTSMIEQAVRKGHLQYVHNEALRRMQAAANKHV
ncbi:uncharacterized protein BDCG_09270 [Blastomyces dermatitidis ER-3]|uniref:TM7S3/TM198-like domain-containing protein n=1 Tax=Ajellomyces dermatitidis (strain ER-3 / ATCC MYA-2586) TaxID=559297 RepID=A0ABP2EQS9_AJEDR|nr:uncharacterized protein BDCG_09270 [Blastomyces dermatitidis ER-3]EEQ86001.2 hypothetical protein BDCG_09270 [Blastomyces dermatitidis ER-3]